MKKAGLNLKFIVLAILCIFCVTNYVVAGSEKSCPLSFDFSFTSLLEEYVRITGNEQYIEGQKELSIQERELIDQVQERVSQEEPHRVLELISNQKENDAIRESAAELLSKALFDPNNTSIKGRYTNDQIISTLAQFVFDRTNNNYIRGKFIVILCLLYKERNVGSVTVLFLRQLRQMLFDKNESEFVKIDIITGLGLFKNPHAVNTIKEVVMSDKAPESVQISAMETLAQNKIADYDIIAALIRKLLNKSVWELEQHSDFVRAVVRTLYSLTAINTTYKPAVEELINLIFFGTKMNWKVSRSLKMEAIPPVEWSLDSLHEYRPRGRIFTPNSGEDIFIDIDTVVKQERNQTFMTLEYSTTFYLAHTLYFMLFNKKELNILRAKSLDRLYAEDHPLTPYIMAAMVSDKREAEWVKYIIVMILNDMPIMDLMSSPEVLVGSQKLLNNSETDPAQSVNGNSADKKSKVDKETSVDKTVVVKELFLREMQANGSANPVHQQFLEALSRPNLIKNKLLEFIADPKNNDPIMKGLMVYALNEWGMLDYTELVKIASNRKEDFNIRIMVVRKIIDDLPLILEKKDSQSDLYAFLAKELVGIFVNPSESWTLRELSAMALLQIKPSDPELQQRIVMYLSDHRDLTNQELLPYFQWISGLPDHLQIPNNVTGIK